MGVLDLADIGDTENCDRAGLVFPVLPARTVAVCLCDGQDFFETALGLLECEEVGYFSRLIYPTCSYDWALGFLRIRAVFLRLMPLPARSAETAMTLVCKHLHVRRRKSAAVIDY